MLYIYKMLPAGKLEADWPCCKQGARVPPPICNQPSPLLNTLFYKHCDPRFQCLLFESSEKFLRSLVGQSVSRPLLVSPSLAHIAADLLGDQYSMRHNSVLAIQDIVWFTTMSYRKTFCGDWLLATLLANGVNHTLRQEGLHWNKVWITSDTKTQTLPDGSSVRHCYCFIYLKMLSFLCFSNQTLRHGADSFLRVRLSIRAWVRKFSKNVGAAGKF